MASSWAASRGYGDLEDRITKGTATPQDIALMGQISSIDPSAGPQAMWNDFVSRVQDRESGGGGLFGIKELSTGIPMLDNIGSMLLGNTTGGMTGYNAATGGNVGQGAGLDLAGLGAGFGLSAGLPLLGGAGTGAADLSAADMAGGLLPEYGSSAAYSAGLGGGAGGAGAFDLGGGLGVDEFGNVTGGLFQGGPGTPGAEEFFNPGGFDVSSLLSKIPGLSNIANLLRRGGGAGGIPGLGGDSNKLLALAPVLAAIAHASSQGPFDTSRLESLYSRFDPSALAHDYDINTGLGRNALTTSLTDRGVMGSSFGNMDLTNFDTTRSLGRNALVNQGVGVAGGLASSILDSQVKSRGLSNDLYGRSLLALGNIFGGRGS
jgi:hypothetical protein